MSELVQEAQEDVLPCPVCASEGLESLVEPDMDADHIFYECEECGYAFGHRKIDNGTRIEGNCSIGVPESVRREASAPMEQAMRKEEAKQPVSLGLTIGKRPGL